MILDKTHKSRLESKEINSRGESRPIVGITFLDKNKYGLKDLYEAYRGDKNYVKQLNDFLEKARSYGTLTELIDNHTPKSNMKNTDDESNKKMVQIQNEHCIETSDMCHLHCCRDGKGSFVLHGFFIGNCFEIVWLDAKHKVHK